jgi:hypothetical protein
MPVRPEGVYADGKSWYFKATLGKSRDAVRTIDLDDQLVRILRDQRKRQAEERLASADYVESDYVFT